MHRVSPREFHSTQTEGQLLPIICCEIDRVVWEVAIVGEHVGDQRRAS